VTGLDAAAVVTAFDALCAPVQPYLLLGGPTSSLTWLCATRSPVASISTPTCRATSPTPAPPASASTRPAWSARAGQPGGYRTRRAHPTRLALLALLRAPEGMPATADRSPVSDREHGNVASSTEVTVCRLFGHVDGRLSPLDGPDWTDEQLERPTQFFNLLVAVLVVATIMFAWLARAE
jgi:hypothetical protein